MSSERVVDGVITFQRMVQHRDKYEVGVEHKLQPEVLLRFGRCKSSKQRVINRVFDVQHNSTNRTMFK